METEVIRKEIEGKSIIVQLIRLSEIFTGKIIFTTSFGLEDQAITHIILDNKIPIEIVTLDTGRLFSETYKVMNETIKKYGHKIKVFFPDRDQVEQMVTEKGPYSFYYSRENRLECCRYRKVIPLNRALEGMECWVSGIRASQSDNRKKMDWFEYDNEKKLFKYYPVFSWSFEQVVSYVKDNNIPYNVLHDKGFVSIGCEPCTRAVKEGEDFRAGRWWWEKSSEKECGLHIK
jgi:phosphoadenosine phosphosulfate reductase